MIQGAIRTRGNDRPDGGQVSALKPVRASETSARCHGASTVGRSYFLPGGPCCGNRHGQLFEYDFSSNQLPLLTRLTRLRGITKPSYNHRNAAERIRTSTGKSPPPPEDGASTGFRHSRGEFQPSASSRLEPDVLEHPRDARPAVDPGTPRVPPILDADQVASVGEELQDVGRMVPEVV